MCGGAKRPVEPFIGSGQDWAAPHEFVERGPSFGTIPEMTMRRGQNRVIIRKFGIRGDRLTRKFDRFLIVLRQQCRPALAQVPNDQQRVARTEPDSPRRNAARPARNRR